ncbi:MAG: HD family phosphohydrolase [Gemmatimonadaceae bacterium]
MILESNDFVNEPAPSQTPLPAPRGTGPGVSVPPDSRTGTRARVAYHGPRIALLLALAMVTYALFPASPAVESPIFEIGSVATENVIAPFGFAVRKTESELGSERNELARSAKPIFLFVPAAVDSARDGLALFMDSMAVAVGEPSDKRVAVAAVQRAAEAFSIKLTPAEAEYLSFAGRRRAMQAGVERVFGRWLASGVAASGAMDEYRGEIIIQRGQDEKGALADTVTTFGMMLARARRMHPDPNSSLGDAIFIKLLSGFFRPTIVLERTATERRRQELRNAVDTTKYLVRAGEKIVGQHEVVGKAEYDKLRALHNESQSRTEGQQALGRVLGAVVYNALVLAIFGMAIVIFRPQLYNSFRSLALFAVVFTIVIAAAALATRTQTVHPELVPVALAAIVLSILFDPRISMIAAMILAVLVGGQSVFRGTNALFMNLIGGSAAALSVRVIRRRDQAYYSILTIAMAYLFAAIAIGLTLGWGARQIGGSALWGIVNALVSVALAMFILPLAERFTHITTDLTLIEYSDLNRPLLRRLSLEAPGTYAHTIAMANLAEAACNAIGANGLLARVGTYYHDIGKLRRPNYFVENLPRTGARNPHDSLEPQASAAIIRDHVSGGLELARTHRLPPVLRSFITEHHGTGNITYFLERAKNGGERVPNSDIYAYPGPVPQTAETAVCMLADGVEAAVRVLRDPTPKMIKDVVDHIVQARVDAGQLREAPLTLRQLDIVKEQFSRVLVGMSHSRIDYPPTGGGITSEFAAT